MFRTNQSVSFWQSAGAFTLTVFLLLTVLLCGHFESVGHLLESKGLGCAAGTLHSSDTSHKTEMFYLAGALFVIIFLVISIRKNLDSKNFTQQRQSTLTLPFLKSLSLMSILHNRISKALRRGIVHPQLYADRANS